MMVGFLIWCAAGALLIGIGIRDLAAKKQVNFWSNAKTQVTDVKGYNRAVGILFCGYGAAEILLGIPLLIESTVGVLLACLGLMLLTVGMILIYTCKIEPKYK